MADVFLAVTIFAAICLADRAVTVEESDIFSLWVIRQYWVFFIGGYLTRRYHLIDYLQSHNILYSMAVLGYPVITYLYISGYHHLFYIAAILMTVILFYLFQQREACNGLIDRTLLFFGKNTLDIYIYHYFIIQLTRLNGFGNWLADTGNVFIEVVVTVLYAITVAFVSIYIGKIIRKSSFLRKVIYGEW